MTTKFKNKVLFLLDSSGSMRSISRPTVDAFNRVLSAIKEGARAAGQETTVGFYTFGESYTPVSRKFFDAPIDAVKPLAYNDYRAEGGTPMFDCIGKAIEDATALKVDDDTSFIVNIITDGEENQSQNFNAASIKKLMNKVQATDKWTITFLVPQGGKGRLVRDFGIPEGNVEEWTADAAGADRAAKQISQGYATYFTARSTGKRSVKGFFTTDLSKLTAKEVKANLTDLSGQVGVLKVNKEADIKAFIEGQGLTYLKGRAFYQLTKDEKVQSHKEIMLQEKGKKAVYGGQEARTLLGLPTYDDVKVRPGNHANWDIFVQSTSVNRKLVRGTTLLYLK
jgi:hypothetical protein